MNAPRASLIVRSVSRPELHDALASAAAQTYGDLEIVIVDATGGRHAPVPERAGGHPVVFVPGAVPRTRPEAANAGLDASSGAYVGLLDDDDMLLPGHVAGLVAALESDPGAVLAFSAARERWPDGTTLHVGHERFSRLTLLDACFFPPCAALFRRSVLAACRFDESLDAAEDWDFWLQVGRCGPFRFVAQETAVYRADLGRSAMTADGGGGGDRWKDLVRQKWAPERDALLREVEARFAAALGGLDRGDVARALDLTGDVLRLYPYHVGALNLRGSLLAQRGDYAEALRDFAVAVEAAPDDAASRFNLGQALERLGRRAEAVAVYRRVLELDPGFAPARERLARLPTHGMPS